MTQPLLDDLIARLGSLPEAERKAIEEEAEQATASMLWVPNPGPQTEAYFCEADELYYGGEAGGGKALELATMLPTPTGWTTMGEVKPGDTLFDENGMPCRVVAVSPVMIGRPCYRMVFSDGAEIVADAGHRWFTTTRAERNTAGKLTDEWRTRRRAARERRAKPASQKPWVSESITRINKERRHDYKPPPGGSIRTTAEIASSILAPRGALNHAIQVAKALQAPKAQVPIDPYLLGAWLGDGTSARAGICIAEAEMAEQVGAVARDCGYELTKHADKYGYGITGGFAAALKTERLINAKHIPASYQRASVDQRIALLQGLMDTDGYCDQRGQCEFTSVNDRLASGVLELIRGLGCKANIGVGIATLYGREISPKYRIKFLAGFPAFRLERKLARQKMVGMRPTTRRRYVEAVDPVQSVPVRCIEVDSPSRLFLAGEAMIPTHNSDLVLGLALTAHSRSLILRRVRDDARDLAERVGSIVGHVNGYNGQALRWSLADRTLFFGGCQHEDDKQRYKGKPHDLKAFDEITDFTESQYTFIIGWTRSATPGQRCRVVVTGNPPTTAEGFWVIKRWAAWLDDKHPRPAKSGEIRWYTTGNDGKEIEVDGPGPHVINGEEVRAKSRTFIRARLSDNPDLAATDYDATLAGLPAELRAAYRDGNFMASVKDAEFQVIPTAWIMAAQARWTPRPPQGMAMTAQALDPAGGGRDTMELASRYGGWYAEMVSAQGEETADGSTSAATVTKHRRDACPVIVDVGGGYGGSVTLRLKDNGIIAVGFNGGKASTAKTLDGQLDFANKRAEVYWRMREALDPDQEGGSVIALPPDPELRADLAAPTWTLTARGILIESKLDLRARLGRSPGKGDAVCMALSEGSRAVMRARHATPGHRPQVQMGHTAQRRKR